MAFQYPNQKNYVYPELIESDPNPNPQSSANLYPRIDMRDLDNLVPETVISCGGIPSTDLHAPSAPPAPMEELLIKIPGAILNLIDKNYSVELACGDLSIVRLRQGNDILAVLARIDNEIQWPLAKDEAVVKLDDSHYFFSLRFLKKHHDSDSSDDEDDKKKKKDKNKKTCKGKNSKDEDEMLNYGLTIASKGQETLLKKFDAILQTYSCFSIHKVSEKAKETGKALLDNSVDKEVSPADLKSENQKELMEERCAAYWTTLAPNVEDYSSSAAKLIATGSGKLIMGILWCGDVTADGLKRGNDVLKQRMITRSNSKVDPDTLRRIQRVKKMTKMTEKVANGLLSGVLKVSGYFTSSIANSKMGKKFLSLIPGEVLLASLDGLDKLCDAVEVAGRNVMSTSSTVTTELVTHRYGEQAAEATNEGLGAAGHAIGTAWAAFKLRRALNPKGVLKPTTLAKSAVKAAAAEMKAKHSK